MRDDDGAVLCRPFWWWQGQQVSDHHGARHNRHQDRRNSEGPDHAGHRPPHEDGERDKAQIQHAVEQRQNVHGELLKERIERAIGEIECGPADEQGGEKMKIRGAVRSEVECAARVGRPRC